MESVYMILNDDQLECRACGQVHDFLTRSVSDNCGVPMLLDEPTAQKLIYEGGGTFMGGRAIEVLVHTSERIINDANA